MRTHRSVTVTGALLIVTLAHRATAQEAHAAGHARDVPQLGTIVFPSSARPAAQRSFLRGVALLHSYEYADAGAAFRETQAVDAAFALAYWMEALTYSHIDWRAENLPASRAALAKLGATPAERLAKAGTSRERQFGAAVEALYMEATQQQRVRAYADSLRGYSRAHAADVEAQAFASHAIMLAGVVATARAERDSMYREAVALSQQVLRAQPGHPGATHYLIHLYDSPGLAARGLEFARAYDKLAPDAEHALHMPSHIYLQLGMWDDVVASNERAWLASRRAGAPSWHTLSWLQYGYLERKRFDRARALIDSARAIGPAVRGSDIDALVAVPRLEFQYAAATGTWTQPLTQPLTQPVGPAPGVMTERETGFRRLALYWSAVDAAMRNDARVMETFAAPFVARADSALMGAELGGSRVALANALVVRALIAKTRGDRNLYLRALRAGADLEKQLDPFVGPPERLFASELLADELIAEGRHVEAADLYRTVLRVCPGRVESVEGLSRTHQQH